ncbi:epidermal growth factor-like protein 7 [Scaptodrosophila lebanonensis]|uniref:Epidermal growth factor-like protein 7 n=1 Tax=Drosophila lebanonensis TaxID=7225 RepID=A0A6J2UCD6_DROLE|nr:epidermal growth factor-like protein 7 [Scaptodrosophila lebanonensis]
MPHTPQQPNAKDDVELLPGVQMPLPRQRGNSSYDVTRLRRIQPHLHPQSHTHSHHNQHKLLRRRLQDARDYNSYNVYTKSNFGRTMPAMPPQDVEIMGVSGTGRGFRYVPSPPPSSAGAMPGPIPPLVPVRRGYATSAPKPTSPDTFGFGSSDSNNINHNYPTDAKDMERRHICVQQRTISTPVKKTEVYTRPTFKHISTPCQPPTHPGQLCTRVQVVHEPAYRDVIKMKHESVQQYDCCTGWGRETPRADACLKPICTSPCKNGGNCTAPETCSCPAGFTGNSCEQDIDECRLDKPCDQKCVNTQGSYYCLCRPGFVLQPDQQSCKKEAVHEDDAFEARDLENDIDEMDAEMVTRLQKIERSLANERIHTNELKKSLQATYSVVDTLKSRLTTLEKQQFDVNRLQTNLYKTESRTNKLEGMLNLLLNCRNGPNAHCP